MPKLRQNVVEKPVRRFYEFYTRSGSSISSLSNYEYYITNIIIFNSNNGTRSNLSRYLPRKLKKALQREKLGNNKTKFANLQTPLQNIFIYCSIAFSSYCSSNIVHFTNLFIRFLIAVCSDLFNIKRRSILTPTIIIRCHLRYKVLR